MKKAVPTMTLVFLAIVSVFSAGQPVPDSDVPSKAEVLKFLDLMHSKAQMVQALDGMAKQMRLGAEQGFKAKVPDATPEQLARVDQLFDGIFKTLPIDDMLDAIVPIYQRHLTKADLVAVTAFYSSPPGQKILKEMPAIMSEAMQAGGEIGRRALATKSQELDQKIAELVKATKAN
jgi:uncharacterized protein